MSADSNHSGVLAASLRLLRSELQLILGRRRNQAGMVALAAFPVLIAVALRLEGPKSGEGSPSLISEVTSNGIFVALTSLTIEIGLFLPLAVAILSGDTIAGEAHTGTLRYLLTVPVSRSRLLVIKYASVVVGALLGVLVVAGSGVIIGGALLGVGPTTLLSGTEISFLASLGRLSASCAYLTFSLAGLAAVGLFLSTLTEQPIAAMVSTVVVSTAMWILNAIPQVAWLHPWLLVNRWPALADTFRDPPFWDVMRTGLLVDSAYIAIFATLAWARFTTKDITS